MKKKRQNKAKYIISNKRCKRKCN